MEYNYGINNIDIVYYINLPHRKDRNQHILNQFFNLNIDSSKINRINGVYIEKLGILGCAKSHCLALEAFILSEKNTCLIFEDDFEFIIDQDSINTIFNRIFTEIEGFDVIMLAANILSSYPTKHDFLIKILDAQTLSGYIVSKQFASILLNNFKEGIFLLEQEGGLKIHPYCIDIYMKRLQPYSRWFCLNPKIGKQIDSYSDIENTIVSYNC